jgi:hypothetical protein
MKLKMKVVRVGGEVVHLEEAGFYQRFCLSLLEARVRLAVRQGYCPKCGKKLNSFSGLEHIPSFLYCPKCNDTMFADTGEVIGKMDSSPDF